MFSHGRHVKNSWELNDLRIQPPAKKQRNTFICCQPLNNSTPSVESRNGKPLRSILASHHSVSSSQEAIAPPRQLQALANQKSDADNLEDAIKAESYEIDILYLEFAKKAKVAGDTAVADRFEEIRHDETGHRDAFKSALAKLESEPTGR